MKLLRNYAIPLAIVTLAVTALADPIAWVINTSGETLSQINLSTGQSRNDLVTLGSDVLSYPNQIVVRDSVAYVVCSGTDEIQLIDLSTETTMGYIGTGINSNPYWMQFRDSQYVYVSFWTSGMLARVDVVNGVVVHQWPVGNSPEGLLIHDERVYVAVTGFNQGTWEYDQGTVVVFDCTTEQLLDTIDVGVNPQYLARDGEGFLHVVCTGDYYSAFGMVYVIDPGIDAVVDSFSLGGSPANLTIGPDDIAYAAAGGWVSDGFVYTFDAATRTPLHTSTNPLVVDSGCTMVVAYQDSTCLVGGFADIIRRIDSSGSGVQAFSLGDGPVHAAVQYIPGDVNGDFDGPDISDLVYLVTYMFSGGQAPPWPSWRANVNGDFIGPDISDLVYLVAHMFSGGPPPKSAPTWPIY